MLEEMFHAMELRPSDPIRFLFVASMLREDFPWIYELGVDAYRISLAGKSEKAMEAQRRFATACRVLRRGPFMEMSGDKETHMHMRELMHLLEHQTMAIEPDEVSDTGTQEKAAEISGRQLPTAGNTVAVRLITMTPCCAIVGGGPP
jgi:hypothetical protein